LALHKEYREWRKQPRKPAVDESRTAHSVAGGQEYEVKYETKKTGRSSAAVKKAVKKVGNNRKRAERRLGR
jgi:Protein of unknown function (DUF3606)